ncbi:hypothetical protein BH11PSE9_BH11PSE9_11140 [soil metagenome]
MRTISLSIDDRTDALLRAACERTGLSESAVLQSALEQFANSTLSSPLRLASELGLVGGFASGVGQLGARHSEILAMALKDALARNRRC